MWETRIWSLGWEDPLEKEMAIHYGTIVWKIPWQRSLVGYIGSIVSLGRKDSDTTERLHFLLPRLVIAFLPRSKMAAVTIFSDCGAQENKIFHCFHCFPIYLPWSDGTVCHRLSFLNVEFWASLFFPLSYFTFIKRLFSSSSLSAIRVVSSAYLRLLIFLQQSWFQLVLHPAQRFSWCTLHIS